MNTLIIKGNLGGDPDIRTSNGTTYASFSIAVNQRVGRGKNPVTDWFRIVAFDKLAETMAHVGRGDEILVTGSLHRTSYTKGDIEYRDVEVRARAVEFLRRSQRIEATLGPDEPAADTQDPDGLLAADASVDAPAEFEQYPAATWVAEPPADGPDADGRARSKSERSSGKRRS